MLKHPPQYYAAKYKTSFMSMAEAVAENSVAIRNKVGCVIYLNDHTLSLGWNGQPSGSDIEACEDGLEEAWKAFKECVQASLSDKSYVIPPDLNSYLTTKQGVLHSEQNAISKITDPELLKGAILFTTLQPCLACSKLIVDVGITHVYYKHKYRCDEGLRYLVDNGTVVTQLAKEG